MIDISDLRIFDVVTTDGECIGTESGRYYRVMNIERLYGYAELCEIKKDNHMYSESGIHVSADNIVPVRLTEEILVKFGFDRYMTDERYAAYSCIDIHSAYALNIVKGKIIVSNYPYSVVVPSYKYWLACVSDDKMREIGKLALNYIHELQHIVLDSIHADLDMYILL